MLRSWPLMVLPMSAGKNFWRTFRRSGLFSFGGRQASRILCCSDGLKRLMSSGSAWLQPALSSHRDLCPYPSHPLAPQPPAQTAPRTHAMVATNGGSSSWTSYRRASTPSHIGSSGRPYRQVSKRTPLGRGKCRHRRPASYQLRRRQPNRHPLMGTFWLVSMHCRSVLLNGSGPARLSVGAARVASLLLSAASGRRR